MSFPLNPSNGQTTIVDGTQFEFDSDLNRWSILQTKETIAITNRIDSDLVNIRLGDLVDVNVIYTPDHNSIVSWDSDLNSWGARQFTNDPLGAIALNSETFIATTNQTEFRLTHYPIGDIQLFRNGLTLIPSCYSVVGKIVTYDASKNENNNIDDSDVVVIVYNYGTSIALTANLADLTDVDVSSVLPKHGEVLAWDSDFSVFVPSSDLRDDLNQAVSDRIFTDGVLSSRITVVENDIASQTGNFYVQATPPVGSANSGWVNTTNLKLHVWDVISEVWTQITLT